MKIKLLIITFLIFIFFFININANEYQNILIPPDAHNKAIQALKRLGPDRGALKISYKTVKIIGIVSKLKFDTKEIKKNLKDLNAKVTNTEIKIAMSGDVLFDFNKWNIRKDAEAELKKVIIIITAYKSPEIIISGHTDSKGTEEYNLKLSLKRAKSVKDWIVKNSSLSNNSFKIFGYGEKNPLFQTKKRMDLII